MTPGYWLFSFVLIALFALDSIFTYIGVSSGKVFEANPIVRAIIADRGLYQAMVDIFVLKTLLLSLSMLFIERPRIKTIWKIIFWLYVFVVTLHITYLIMP